jgi:hypothetical protein
MSLKTLTILALSVFSVNTLAQKKHLHGPRADRNALADAYFAYRSTETKTKREQAHLQKHRYNSRHISGESR